MHTILDIVGAAVLVVLIINAVIFTICITPCSLWTYLAGPAPSDPNAAPQLQPAPVIAAQPFVSVHLAIYDEPADVVIATLAALEKLAYQQFEVVVVDNNTPLRSTWLPVSEYCQHNPRLRFYHFSGVKGAKAGALNIALDLMNPAARYVAVVDADYQVVPEFLQIAVSECQRHAHQFVQFPQAYRDTDGASAIDRELGDYFAVYSSRASHDGAMLPTGTLSLICADTLRKVGGWPTASVTEDAEIGMRMWRMGASGRYVDRVVGRGMLPLDLQGLRSQRYRWAAGNTRTLLCHLTAGFARWPAQGRWAVLAQLTAWIGFAAVPLVALAAALTAQEITAPGMTADNAEWVWPAVQQLAAGTLLAALFAMVIAALIRQRLETVPVKLALWWTSSFAWPPQLWRSTTPFLRTPKYAAALPFRLSIDTGCSMLALVMAVEYARLGLAFPALALACSASTLVVAPLVDRALKTAAQPAARARASRQPQVTV